MASSTRPRVGRPLGDVSQALRAAVAHEPATMAQLAQRAGVDYEVARFKVPALARGGTLVALNAARPRLYALPQQRPIDEALRRLQRLFWGAPLGTRLAED